MCRGPLAEGEIPMKWSDGAADQLSFLWSEGHSTKEIGRRLEITKSAVIGKARRLDLPPRPNPIPRAMLPLLTTSVFKMQTPVTPPRAVVIPPPAPITISVSEPLQAKPADQPVQVMQLPSQPKPEIIQPYKRTGTCCWPIGEPGTKSFHFCGVHFRTKGSYCDEHTKIAYVRVRDRREDAT